ncbi:MAG: hypothetical protein LDL33_03275 [Desulfomonile sp.]|nr:hypothetical protein [Desulfomonile sp.]
MRNALAIRRLLVALTLCMLIVTGLTANALPADTKPAEKTKTTTLQVPTSGTILDVTYLPEFEEWWVKCREGEKIAVYSYDRLSKSWGKVVFEAKKPDATVTTGKPEAAKPSSVPAVSDQTEEQKKEPPAVVADTPEKMKEKAPSEKKKWWNPIFDVFKQK